MALRDKLRERTQPFLCEGEQIEHIALAQAANPWMVGFGGGLFMLLFGKPRGIVATSSSIVVLRQSKWSATPEEVLARLPRGTRIGPVGGLWAKSVVNGEQLWIHRRIPPRRGGDGRCGRLAGLDGPRRSGRSAQVADRCVVGCRRSCHRAGRGRVQDGLDDHEKEGDEDEPVAGRAVGEEETDHEQGDPDQGEPVLPEHGEEHGSLWPRP